ncbi:MAG: sigma-54 dependent transcriptional regulator [Nitrospirota bacterium]
MSDGREVRLDTNGKVLVVDDEPNAVRVLSAILSEGGYHVFESGDVEKAIGIVKTEDVDAIITDLKMPGRDGMNFFDYITENHSDIPVIFLTAYGTVESAVHAVTRGAFYYFIKPPDYWKLKSILSRAVEQRCLKRELESLRRRLLNENDHHRIIGKTPEMRRLYETIEAVRDSSSNVLISGETGTGKELFARALHYSSNRKDTPFVAVNCAAIPRELIESELFGYEKGAFTGALSRRIGKFEEAGNGIVFLDEVGELELSLQAKLLRAFQEREVERLGSNRRIKVEFRLICSTNRDLRKEVQNGNFREDLFYRLNVIEIKVPPLRERRDDIPLLVSEFVHEFCLREKKTLTVSAEVMEMFQRHRWPGNIRQLRNVIERAVVLAREKTITAKELSEEFLSCWKQGVVYKSVKTLKDLEIQAVSDALHVCKGNKSKAAKVLGISRKAFYKRLKEIHC